MLSTFMRDRAPVRSSSRRSRSAQVRRNRAEAMQRLRTGESIRFIEEKGKGTGLGAVAGGVFGGVLGHQIGSGTGRTVATVAGAAGGAYVGNTVEKNKNTKAYWHGHDQDGRRQYAQFHYSNQPSVHEGERVKLVDGGRRLALIAN